jgi:hypothetical protein
MFRVFASGDVFIVVVVGVLAFALGFWGFWECSFTFVPDPADAAKKVPYYFKDAACHLQNTWHVFIATFNLVRAGGDFAI